MRRPSYFARYLAILLIGGIAAPARVEPSHGFDMFSTQEEVQAGQQASDQVRKQLPLLPDSSPVTQYVQRLGAQLAAHAPGEKWPYSFHVVNQKEINAFALPGGPVYVNLGTIQAADNEAELAGVMAHEISHVVQRHGTRAASKQMMAQLPLALLGGLMGRGALSQMAQLGISFGVGSYFLKNSRQAESEADLLGTDIMYDTGFNPHAMADFFEKIEKEGGTSGPQFLSDHPNPGNRREAVTKEVNTLPRKSYRPDSPEFLSVKQTVGGMHPLTAQEIAAQQKQGTTASEAGGLSPDVAPSRSRKTLNHSLFRIDYPDNWQIFGDQSSAVTIAPRSGVSQDAIAYGVMINGYQPEGNANLDTATHQLIASLRQSNPDLREIGHDEDIRVNGMPGKSLDMIGTSPVQVQGGRAVSERDWLVTFQRSDGNLLYLVFISPDQHFGKLRPTFEEMLKSVHVK
jgi:Zn-dependent protease with chaperone function